MRLLHACLLFGFTSLIVLATSEQCDNISHVTERVAPESSPEITLLSRTSVKLHVEQAMPVPVTTRESSAPRDITLVLERRPAPLVRKEPTRTSQEPKTHALPFNLAGGLTLPQRLLLKFSAEWDTTLLVQPTRALYVQQGITVIPKLIRRPLLVFPVDMLRLRALGRTVNGVRPVTLTISTVQRAAVNVALDGTILKGRRLIASIALVWGRQSKGRPQALHPVTSACSPSRITLVPAIKPRTGSVHQHERH
ncbi:hypothetical protein FRC17_009243 [Serendipita sp. 399]|nr:hypothetical protein FRC17_009243 [Serendipita sp. 399]